MCLFVDREATNKAKRNPQGYITRYKILWKTQDGRLVSWYKNYVWEPGLNKSSYRNDPTKCKLKEVRQGFHVYKSKKAVKAHKDQYVAYGRKVVVVPFICKNKDLIAVGRSTEAYKEVYLTKTAYKKVFHKKKRKVPA